MNNTKYHINVCHSLVTERGLNCSSGASICKITIRDDGKETITVSRETECLSNR